MADENEKESPKAQLKDLSAYRRQKEKDAGRPSWVPWVLGGAAVLGFMAGLLADLAATKEEGGAQET